jgi:hypothetical protein
MRQDKNIAKQDKAKRDKAKTFDTRVAAGQQLCQLLRAFHGANYVI